MENKWPRITVLENLNIQITFPADRPYEQEVITYMESKGYILVGTGCYLPTMERDLFFKQLPEPGFATR